LERVAHPGDFRQPESSSNEQVDRKDPDERAQNARSCPASREVLVKRVCEQGRSVREASEGVRISDRRAREWIRRHEAGENLTDRSSKPHRSRIIDQQTQERVLELRREWRTMRQIAQTVGIGQTSVARICRVAGLSRLRQLESV
jgi:transposase